MILGTELSLRVLWPTLFTIAACMLFAMLVRRPFKIISERCWVSKFLFGRFCRNQKLRVSAR